jgi:toxin ParE1/3/4
MPRWTADATADVRDVWDYIAEDNEPAADRIVERLISAAGILDRHPLIGRTGKEPCTRELVVSGTRYILIYRVKARKAEILRVLHGKQDWPPKG